MRIENKGNGIYVKSLSEVEAYLLNIIERFFEHEQSSIWESRESIILESVRRAKEEVIAESGSVLSVNGMKGEVELDYSHVGAEPIIQKKTAFNKNFGNKAGTVCEGNDPRLDKSNYYTRIETDSIVDELKRKFAGVKFYINTDSWIRAGNKYKATLSHRLNLNLEALSVSFYKDFDSVDLEYRYINNNNIEIFSDIAFDLTVILRQSVVSTVKIPVEIKNQIDSNTENTNINAGNINANTEKINANKTEITKTNNNITKLDVKIQNNTNELEKAKENISLNRNEINLVKESLNGKANLNHSHRVNDIEDIDEHLFVKDWGEVNALNNISVKIKRGSNASLNTYVGKEAELIYNKDTKTLHVMDGNKTGGHKMSKEGHTHDYNELLNIPSLNLNNYYTKSETYSSSEIDDKFTNFRPSIITDNFYTKDIVDEKFRVLNALEDQIGPNEEYPEGNISYIVANSKADIVKLKRTELTTTKIDITEDDWEYNPQTELYEYIYNHQEDTTLEFLDIKFYINNCSYIFDYEYVDRNNVKIFSIENTKLTICTKNKIGYRNDSLDDEGVGGFD